MKPQVVKTILNSQDMNRAVTFYTDIMGFEKCFVSPHWAELKSGNSILGLVGGGDGSSNETGLSIQYEDVQVAYENALKAGSKSIDAPTQRAGEPIIISKIADPEGNVVILTQYLENPEQK